MTTTRSALVGRWRIVEADLRDVDYLDLCGPASRRRRARRNRLWPMQAGLDIAYSAADIDFT